MTETAIMQRIQIELGKLGVMLFRNNSGAYKTSAGHYVRYGLGDKGGSDLIGVTPIKNKSGKLTGVFTALEVKSPTGRVTTEQQNFINAINKQGGIAGVVRSVEDAVQLIEGFKNGNN